MAAYAMVDELHQAFVPTRSAAAFDLVKDLSGIALLWHLISRGCVQGRPSAAAPILEKVTVWVTSSRLADGEKKLA